jgi:hypothetical protein
MTAITRETPLRISQVVVVKARISPKRTPVRKARESQRRGMASFLWVQKEVAVYLYLQQLISRGKQIHCK